MRRSRPCRWTGRPTASSLTSQTGTRSPMSSSNWPPRHADATLLVNAAGFFIPRPFLDLRRRVLRLLPGAGTGDLLSHPDRGPAAWSTPATTAGRSSTSAACGRTRPSRATPSSGYSVAKAGLHALTRNLAMELASYHRIRVNAVAPAIVATPLYERLVPRDQIEQTLRRLRQLPPARPGRHRPRPRQHHHLPAAPLADQLGHRRHLGRRRRRHGRPGPTTTARDLNLEVERPGAK